MHTHRTSITPIHIYHKPPNTAPFSPAPLRSANGAGFILHEKNAWLTNVQFTHKQELIWGVHNTRLLSHSPTLRCPMCGEFTSNSHMAGK
jgi:hypothetical protein